MIFSKLYKYSDYIVVYLDICGFRDEIEKSNDKNIRNNIGNLLIDLQHIASQRTKQNQSSNLPDLRISIMSDSIIISSPTISPESFRYILLQVSEFCLKAILRHNFFIRGAITIGSHWENKDILFGPAFIKAYDMERSLARWPRCIVDPDIMKRRDICPSGPWEKQYFYLLKDNDGLLYLDYLGFPVNVAQQNWSYTEKDNPDKNLLGLFNVMIDLVKYHKKAIYKAIRKSKKYGKKSMFLLTRYYPLALYHNKVILRWTQRSQKSDIKKFVTLIEYAAKKDKKDADTIARMKRLSIELITNYRKNFRLALINMDKLFTNR